jgi:hypothetical protein
LSARALIDAGYYLNDEIARRIGGGVEPAQVREWKKREGRKRCRGVQLAGKAARPASANAQELAALLEVHAMEGRTGAQARIAYAARGVRFLLKTGECSNTDCVAERDAVHSLQLSTGYTLLQPTCLECRAFAARQNYNAATGGCARPRVGADGSRAYQGADDGGVAVCAAVRRATAPLLTGAPVVVQVGGLDGGVLAVDPAAPAEAMAFAYACSHAVEAGGAAKRGLAVKRPRAPPLALAAEGGSSIGTVHEGGGPVPGGAGAAAGVALKERPTCSAVLAWVRGKSAGSETLEPGWKKFVELINISMSEGRLKERGLWTTEWRSVWDRPEGGARFDLVDGYGGRARCKSKARRVFTGGVKQMANTAAGQRLLCGAIACGGDPAKAIENIMTGAAPLSLAATSSLQKGAILAVEFELVD